MRVVWLINSLWRVPLIILVTAVLASISVLFSLFDASGRLQHRCARAWADFIFWVSRVELELEGLERIDPEKGYVFTANHLSMFDHWAFLSGLPVQFRFAAKESLFKLPFLGWHLRRAGNIPVSSTNYRRTVREFQNAARHIERGISYVIYPEGGRTWGKMLRFKKGSFLLPVHARAPIVPVTIIDAHKRLARGSALLVPGTMKLIIHDPVSPQDYQGIDLQTLADRVQATVASAYPETSNGQS
ncbi:MAG TPA: lysophospholipid acyltransferase family protein [Acidobacteriota bacterium]|nr:lysophospholipid acyltransferase family protein [Acidobacteriota bacterium]